METRTALLIASVFLALLWEHRSEAEPISTCDFECESHPRFGKLSCEGQLLQCVPDPCCKTDTRHLSMAHNQLTHLKILAFKSFPRLKVLDLRQNAIANIAPGAFSNLEELQLLDLRANQVRYLYTGMFNGLTALKKLYLANNNIETIAPGTFTGMTNLISLKLNYNGLTGLGSNMFHSLQALQRLYIYGNQITTVHEHAFSGLANLVTLSLAENPLVTFPNFLPYLPEISYIRLQNTPLICDCRLEFLRVWLRENMYNAYESYAMCSQPNQYLGIPIYRIPDPIRCATTKDGPSQVNRETIVQSPHPRDSPISTGPLNLDSESDYSEVLTSFSDPSQRSGSRKGTRTNGKGAGRRDTRPSSTARGRVDPLTPRRAITPTGSSGVTGGHRLTIRHGIHHITPPTVTQPLRKDKPEDGFPAPPGTNGVSSADSRFSTTFHDMPRPPRTGSRSDTSWHNADRSYQSRQDDSFLPTPSHTTPEPPKSPKVDEVPPGAPTAWGLRGSSVTIDCPVHVHNANESKIKWLTPHGKLVMSNVSRYAITKRGSLVIHNLQAYDHGTYKCIVRTALNSVKMLPTRLMLACPCHETSGQQPFGPGSNASGQADYDPAKHPQERPPRHESGCSSVPMVVAIVTTFQATVALCVITFCLCCSKNINSSFKDRTCTGMPEPISVMNTQEKVDPKSQDFGRSTETGSGSGLSSRASDFYEALTDRFAPRQASSIRSSDSFYDSQSEYVNYRRPKNYMYMIGYMDTSKGQKAIGYRSSSESQCASIREITNENIYVSKD